MPIFNAAAQIDERLEEARSMQVKLSNTVNVEQDHYEMKTKITFYLLFGRMKCEKDVSVPEVCAIT